MTEIKVSQLPEASEINDADLLMIVQSGTNKKITKANARFASGDEISIGTTEPTEEEKIWIKSDETTDQARYKDGNTWKKLSIKALDSMEIGSIIAFAGDTIPTGWLVCDGSSITQSAYPELYALIGGTLPNFKGRTLVGKDSNDTAFDTLLETGGEKTHTLTIDEMPKHRHTYDRFTDPSYFNNNGSGQLGGYYNATNNTGYAGGDQPHNNLQPYAVINWIIKAKNTTPTMASIVDDYSTSTQDGYSCNFVNDLVNYSTTETIIGKYGNETLYRKVINLGSIVDAVENTWTTITDVSTLNISKIIDCKAISNNGCIWSGYLTRISDGNLQFYNGITTWGSNTIILEYTKTTD